MPAVAEKVTWYRGAGAALAALSAALLVFGSWSASWWSGTDAGLSISAGLRFVEQCGAGEGCQQAPLASLGGEGWMQVGIGAFTAGMVGAALLLGAIARALATPDKRSAIPGAATTACVLAVGAGILFIVLAPENLHRQGVGAGLITYFAGAALGAGAAGGLLSARSTKSAA